MLTSYGVGRVQASEGDVFLLPRAYKPDGTRRAVIYCHNVGGSALQAIPGATSDDDGLTGLLHALGKVFPVISCDLGGTATWGNATVQTRIGTARSYAQASLGAKTGGVFLLGYSMGGAAAVNYADANPSNVAAMVGVLPVSDLDDIRDNNRPNGEGELPNNRGSIDTAWGVTYPTALPAGANPYDNHASASAVPAYAFYASDDPTVLPATVTELWGERLGGDVEDAGALGHDDDIPEAINPLHVIDFLWSHN